VFADLTAAYDTAWHRGLTCKLLQLLPDRHMVRMIMVRIIIEMVGNRSFTLTTGNGKRCRLLRLKNGVPQGSVAGDPSLQHLHLWPANHHLQKVCICWRSSNHACWWRLAGSGRVAMDLAAVGEYLQTWKQKLSTTKTISAVFHPTRKLNVSSKSNRLYILFRIFYSQCESNYLAWKYTPKLFLFCFVFLLYLSNYFCYFFTLLFFYINIFLPHQIPSIKFDPLICVHQHALSSVHFLHHVLCLFVFLIVLNPKIFFS